ncbi:MAG: Crp/Fnr family transcriptional regulator [Thermomicrobiales bacterium]
MKFAPRDGSAARTLAFTAPNPPRHNGSPPSGWHTPAPPAPIQTQTAIDRIRHRPLDGRFVPSRPTTITYQRGHEIFTPGHGADLVYVVRTGCVRLYKVLPDGRSINLGLLGPTTVFTQEDGVDGIATGSIAEALVESTVSIVEVDDLSALVADAPELAGALVSGMTRRLTELQTLVEHLLVRDTAVRLATTLLNLAERFGRPTSDGKVAITLPLTHQSLANMIGSNRVTVTRKLIDLQDGGYVRSLGRNGMAVDPAMLRQYAHNASEMG